MKTTKEMIEVMQAYLKGEKIEYRYGHTDWLECRIPIWDWNNLDYRVKKTKSKKTKTKTKTKYLPFETVDEFLTAQIEHGSIIKMIDDDRLLSAFFRADGSVLFVLPKSICEKLLINVNDLCGKYEFADGTPCGKEVGLCQH